MKKTYESPSSELLVTAWEDRFLNGTNEPLRNVDFDPFSDE